MDNATVSVADVEQVFNLTSDAILSCSADGTILRVNRRLCQLERAEASDLIGVDVKDLLFSPSFERASHTLPLEADGCDAPLVLKLADGSFIPVVARAVALMRGDEPVTVIAFHSVEERQAHEREREKLIAELGSANRRLSGTLSIILSSMGTANLPDLLSSVLNELAGTLDAHGAVIYFGESGGFKLRGVSDGLAGARVAGFVPYGTGVQTLVVREDRSLRLAYLPVPVPGEGAPRTGLYLDLDSRVRHRFRLQDLPPFQTLVAVPLHFGTRVLGIIEVGWARPYTPRTTDVQVLEAVCEYLSIELMDIIASLRSQRRSDLARSLSRVRDALFSDTANLEKIRHFMLSEITTNLSCRVKEIERDARTGEDYFDFGTFGKLLLPRNIAPLFFSSTAPAVRMSSERDAFMSELDAVAGEAGSFGDDAEERLETVRLARIDQGSPVGEWLTAHGLPSSGVFVDLGIDDERRRGFLLMRLADQEPFDDMEYDYLAHMMHDYELSRNGLAAKREERRIAQALQRGMESRLQDVPGITSDSLYSSATQQALVGGDFFELIRLPDDRAVMILGDVSGKGVEVASMSALVKTALSAYAWEGMSPARMVRALNGMLLSFSRVETFATMFVARIDLRAGRAVYCSAGHPPAMVYRAAAGEVELLSRQSGVVGAFQTMTYHEGRFSFDAGDMLFLYTDGAIEARDAEGAFFGEDRLRELVLTVAPQGVHGFCNRVLYELDRFTGSRLNDDIALVMLRFDRGRDTADRHAAEGGSPARRKRSERRAHGVPEALRAPSGTGADAAGAEGSAGASGRRKAAQGAALGPQRAQAAGGRSQGGKEAPAAAGAPEDSARPGEAESARFSSKRAASAGAALRKRKERKASAAEKPVRKHSAGKAKKDAAQKGKGVRKADRKRKDAAAGSFVSDFTHAPVDLGKRVLRHWMKDRPGDGE